MHVNVNGVRLFFEVFGQKLVPDGPRMRERPTVVFLHGGPSDHAHLRDMLGPLPDAAQILLYDHRGCGRSEQGDPSLWTMEQWGDDVRGLCDALGIEKPIVVGGSFGGFVAQAYAIRHPDHPSKLGLIVTGTRHNREWSKDGFRKQGGDEAADAYEAMVSAPSAKTYAEFIAKCRHLYTTRRIVDADLASRSRTNLRLGQHYMSRPDNWFDFREGLTKVRTPVLILGGEEDPMLPPSFQDELERSLVNASVQRISFPNAGHFLHLDVPDAYHEALRAFVEGAGANT